MKNIFGTPAYLEWESFQWPLTFSRIKCHKGIYDLPADSNVDITRNDEYGLTGTISGVVDASRNIEYKGGEDIQAGEFMELEELSGSKSGYETINLEGVLLGGIQKVGLSGTPGGNFSFSSKFRCSKVEYKINGTEEDKVETLLEFYLCSTTQFFWPRATRRVAVTKGSKIRIGTDEEVEEPSEVIGHEEGNGRDHFIIDTPEYHIIVQQVAQKFLPSWSGGVQLEFRSSAKGIPGPEDRQGISEIIGFVLGTQLIKIGENHIGDSGIMKKIAVSPLGDNIVSRCSSQARPPIKIGSYENWGKIERVLNDLLPKYLEKRTTYNLPDVLWKYWIATDLPVGTNLPILSSAMETLAESYIKGNGLTRSYSKTEKSEHEKLVSPELEILKSKLEPFDYKNSVINKLANPFTIGVGEKLKTFFQHIGFLYGPKDIENRAMQARNAMTHGALGVNSEDVRKYIKLTHAYESLFNRVLLKVLGYEGDYVDYSSEGHPDLDLSENLKGML